MEIHNKYTLTQHICLNQGVPDHYTSIVPRTGDLFYIGLPQTLSILDFSNTNIKGENNLNAIYK